MIARRYIIVLPNIIALLEAQISFRRFKLNARENACRVEKSEQYWITALDLDILRCRMSSLNHVAIFLKFFTPRNHLLQSIIYSCLHKQTDRFMYHVVFRLKCSNSSRSTLFNFDHCLHSKIIQLYDCLKV
jgi:hypothetical protein